MAEAPGKIVVVGASVAGVRTAEALRRRGYAGRLTIVGAETHFPPYDRPTFSKGMLQVGSVQEPPRVRVRHELGAELMLGVTADALDVADRTVSLANGDVLDFDALAIATGATPRRLNGRHGDLAGVFALRTLEDGMALRAALERAPRVVVVGGGFIGGEVASSCRQRGLDVTVVESLAAPLTQSLGAVAGEWMAELHREHGTTLLTSATVVGLRGTGRVEAVELADGTLLPADAVVVGIGAEPQTAWLRGSGLTVDDGVVLDQRCTAVGAAHVTAAGDVARWFNPLFATSMRIEHWCNAMDQAEAAAAGLLEGSGAADPFASVPYFWSDQYDTKIQFVGIPGSQTQLVEGTRPQGRFVMVYGEHGQVTGALCVNSPARVGRYRRVVAQRAPFPLEAPQAMATTREAE